MQRIEENFNSSLQKLSELQNNITDSNYSELLVGAGSRVNNDLVVEGIPQDFMKVTILLAPFSHIIYPATITINQKETLWNTLLK